MIMCTFGSISGFLKPRIQTSRNPGIPRIWLVFANFNIRVFFFHSVFVPKLDFQCEIPKFYHSWNLPGNIWSSGIPLGNDLFFCKVQHIGYFTHSIFDPELGFQCRIPSIFGKSLILPKFDTLDINVVILCTFGRIFGFFNPGIHT